MASVLLRSGPALTRQFTVLLLAVVTANCHVADVTAPARIEPVRMTFAGDSVIVLGTRALPRVEATTNGVPLAGPHIRLESSDTSVLGISAAGDSVVAKRLGHATLTASLESSLFPSPPPAVARTVYVVPATFEIVPGTVNIYALGDTVDVGVTALDGFDQPIAGVNPIWRVGDVTIGRAIGNRVTGLRVGTTELMAIIDGDTARAPLVVSQRLAHYGFPTSRVVLDAIGAEHQLTATGYDSRGNVIPDAVPPAWSSADTTRLTVTIGGQLRARANGLVNILAGRSDGGADTVQVEVNQRAVQVVITPVTTLAIKSKGGTIDLLGRGFDRLGNTVNDDVPFWRSLDERIAVVDSSGLRRVTVTGYAGGNVGIVAQQDGATDMVTVTVVNDPASIALTPEFVTLTSKNDSLPLSAVVRNGEGGTIPEATVVWRSTDEFVSRVLASGIIVAGDSGAARVIAQVTNAGGETYADTTFVSVTNAPVSVDFPQSELALTFIGDTRFPTISILNARGDSLARNRVHWATQDGAVAFVNSHGQVTATGVGTTWLYADGTVARDAMKIVVTNEVASVTIDGLPNGAIDTIPQVGSSIQFTATARDAGGGVNAGYPLQWSSTSPGVVSVDANGLATAQGSGFARIIVAAASVADTALVVVRRPTRIHVDNERVVGQQFGTLARPFATIAQGIAATQPGDTVIVADGTPYVEAVVIGRGITLVGDSAAYLATGRDPSRLPVLAPPAGSTAIGITSGLTVVRHLAIQNAVDGTAVVARGADVTLSDLFVNPGLASGARGAGILVEGVPSAARLDSVHVESVRGYGVRIVNSVDARVARSIVRRVATVSGTVGTGSDGVGIAIEGGLGGSISQSTVRSADGTALLLAGTADASLVANTVAGERQLAVIQGATGTTVVTDNNFDLARLAADPYTGNSTTDGRSGLAIRSSTNVQVERNRFSDAAATASLMDAIRLSDARMARLIGNRFTGGRRAVRTERSSWVQMRSYAQGVALVVEALDTDTLTLTDDTLSNTSASCLWLRNAVTRLTRVRLTQCGTGDAGALDVTGGSMTADQLLVSGSNPRAILVDSARGATVRRSTFRGPGAGSIGIGGRAGVELVADSVQLTGSFVTGYPDRGGVYASGSWVRIDSNAVNRSRTSVALGGTPVSLTLRDNDLYDADLAALDVAFPAPASANWWGDGRGPRGTSTATVGDTVWGTPLTSPYRTTPVRAGIAAARLHMLRGDNQVAAAGLAFPYPFSVRVTDADGLPVRGIPVTFSRTVGKCTFGGFVSVNVLSDDSGIAEASAEMGKPAGLCTFRVTATGASDALEFNVAAP